MVEGNEWGVENPIKMHSTRGSGINAPLLLKRIPDGGTTIQEERKSKEYKRHTFPMYYYDRHK